MSLIVRKKSTAQGTSGLHQARLWGVRNLGLQDYGYGQKEMISLEFCLDEQDAEGNYIVTEMHCQASLHSKSKLYSVVQALTPGGNVPAEVDLDSLKGTLCQVILTPRTARDGTVWSNISQIMPVAQARPMAPPPSAPAPAVTQMPASPPPSNPPPPGPRMPF